MMNLFDPFQSSLVEPFFNDWETDFRPRTRRRSLIPTTASGSTTTAMTASPRCDVRETNDSINIMAEFPGASKEDIDIQYSDHMLNLSTNKAEENERDETDEE
eukprot:Awhi_evm1s9904